VPNEADSSKARYWTELLDVVLDLIG
jgi:hypothetical protein